MEPKADATLAVELRFLRARRRTVQQARPDGGFETVPELRLGDRTLVPGTRERRSASRRSHPSTNSWVKE